MGMNKDNRIIEKLPQPYKPETAVRKQTNFNVKTREACASDKLGQNGMKNCKTIVIGDVGTGKTCLVNRYCKDLFETDYKATIGVDFQVEIYNILGHPFTMQLWDTAGQERFKCIASAYYRGADVILVVFDLSDIKTLDGSSRWLNEALAENANHCPDVFLVGTKKDLCKPIDLKKIEERAMEVATAANAEYWSVSSKTAENVNLLFTRSAALAFDQVILREIQDTELFGNKEKPQIGNELLRLDNTTHKDPAGTRKGCCK